MEEEKKRQLRIKIASIIQDCKVAQDKIENIDLKINTLEAEKRSEEGKLANLWLRRNEMIVELNRVKE